MSAATPEQAALRLAVITEVREAAYCDSDDGDQCQKCTRHAEAILAAVAAQQPKPAPGDVLVTPGDGTPIGGLLAHVGVEPKPAPELTHTREDVIASYNAGYIAAVEKRAQPAPELVAVLDGLESAALKGQVSGLLAVLSSLPVLAAEWEADAKGLDEDNRAAGAQEWTYRAAQLRECAASLRELAGGLS